MISKVLRLKRRTLPAKSDAESSEKPTPEADVEQSPVETVSGAMSIPDILLCIASAIDSNVDLLRLSLCNRALYTILTPARIHSVALTADKLWSLSLLLRREDFAKSCRAVKVISFYQPSELDGSAQVEFSLVDKDEWGQSRVTALYALGTILRSIGGAVEHGGGLRYFSAPCVGWFPEYDAKLQLEKIKRKKDDEIIDWRGDIELGKRTRKQMRNLAVRTLDWKCDEIVRFVLEKVTQDGVAEDAEDFQSTADMCLELSKSSSVIEDIAVDVLHEAWVSTKTSLHLTF